MKEINLGNVVRDAVSGFSGIAIQRLEKLNGNVQIAIQPKQKEGENDFPEAMFIDEHMLEFVDEGFADRTTDAPECEIRLGENVEDRVTLVVGVATAKSTYMNGCVSYCVEPSSKDGRKLPDGIWFDHVRLKVCGIGLRDVIKPKNADSKTGKVPGGPSQRACKSR